MVNGDARPGSDLDFYSGPMTRHKQQLLQEQECLLEQIQRQNNSDTSEDLGHDETKLLTSLRKKKDNAGSPDTNGTGARCSPTSVKSYSKDSVGNDSSARVNNRLYPSKLLAILRDDEQGTKNGKQQTGSVDDLTQLQRQELLDSIKLLDNSLFGQSLVETSKSMNRWGGVENASNVYSAYSTGKLTVVYFKMVLAVRNFRDLIFLRSFNFATTFRNIFYFYIF